MFVIISSFTAQYVKHFHFLQICMNHILAVLRIPAERASGFIALGEMAGALDGELVYYLPTIMAPLRDAVCHIQLLLTSSVPQCCIFVLHFWFTFVEFFFLTLSL